MSRDDRGTAMSGGELALRLFGAFRDLVDEVHSELARRGHPDVRPVHGFALQAVGAGGATAGELGARLGVSKQAAGKTVDGLVGQGYVARAVDPADARRKIVTLTARGRELLDLSGTIFERLRHERAERIGTERWRELEAALRLLTASGPGPLDAHDWWAAPDAGHR